MSSTELLARVEHRLRPLLSRLPPMLATRVFSKGRSYFIDKLSRELPDVRSVDHPGVDAWGIHFRLPIWNAAGMFKRGEAYDVVARQGAGAYVAGTTTSRARLGNSRHGIKGPTAAYANAMAASNWLGLPNEGHEVVAKRLSKLERVQGCPVGASVSAEPGLDETIALDELVQGMRHYQNAKVDYLELNESCPNVPSHGGGSSLEQDLIRRLEYVSQHFLQQRPSPLPVVVKFSVDTEEDQLEDLLRLLIDLRFDGIILGNTSTRYAEFRDLFPPSEQRLFDRFSKEFGGGLSGAPLQDDSYRLSVRAQKIVEVLAPGQEFHVIRCGGLFDANDINKSASNGVVLHQWYTGYFDAFARYGHDVYVEISKSLRV